MKRKEVSISTQVVVDELVYLGRGTIPDAFEKQVDKDSVINLSRTAPIHNFDDSHEISTETVEHVSIKSIEEKEYGKECRNQSQVRS